jgi:hypothetical protein
MPRMPGSPFAGLRILMTFAGRYEPAESEHAELSYEPLR